MVKFVLLFAVLTIITKGEIKLILDSVLMESWATVPQFFLLLSLPTLLSELEFP